MSERHFQLHAKFHFYGALTILVVSFLLVILLAAQPPGASRLGRFYPGCALHKMTGLYCGGCGGTRAVAALARGQFRQAVSYNALVVFLLAPMFGAWLLHALVYGLSGKKLVPWTKIPLWVYICVILLFFVFTVVRNVPAAPFVWLAPHELTDSDCGPAQN